jgi:uncharacterized membrane protein YfhO
VFWVVLLPGAMGCIVLMLLFHVESARFQIFLLLSMAVFLAMVLFIIVALDRPFQGELGIPDDPYRLVRDQYMRR